jgi:hypothetical protein
MTLETWAARAKLPPQRVRKSAQLELLTLNQRIHGSSPCAPIVEINNLDCILGQSTGKPSVPVSAR